MRCCKRCGENKPASEFRFRADKNLHVTSCLRCESATQAVYYRRMKDADPLKWRVQVIRGCRSKFATKEWLLSKLEEQSHKCALTGRPITIFDLEVDHIIPRTEGGGDELTNLQLVYRAANAAKGALSQDSLIDLCADILRTLRPELIGRAIMRAELAEACDAA